MTARKKPSYSLGKRFEKQFVRRFEAMRERGRHETYKIAQLMQHILGDEALSEAESLLAEAEHRFAKAFFAEPLDEEATDNASVDIWIWRDVVLALQAMDSAPAGRV
jgi:hypothetical protein